MASASLLDIARLNNNDKVVGLIEENLKYSPEALTIPFRTIKGTSYRTGIRTALPTTGFRNANEGQAAGSSTFRNQIVEAFIFGGVIKADKAVADAYEDGANAWKALEASGVMQSALRKIGAQTWYGVSTDSKGFPGLKAATVAGSTTLAGDAITIDATGTTADTASSVYLIKAGTQDVQFIAGNNTAFELGDFTEQLVAGPSASTEFMAYVAALTSWIGLQIGHENAARRIYNLTADSGKGLTDVLLARAMATFPIGHRPTHIFMSRRSQSQLQISRTVVLNGNGNVRPNQENLAPLPTTYDGIPIVATDSILNTDAINS